MVSNAQYLLFTSFYELESQVVDALRPKFPFPLYPVGPSIPYFELHKSSTISSYDQWLDRQAEGSVLYISQGSFLSVSSTQMDEIVAGVKQSGVPFLWVSRGDNSRFNDVAGETGLVVPWCDQLRVLCHPSVGGFWTHCGWNSTLEAIFAGVPMLACPIFWDQFPNSKQIEEEWTIGMSVKAGMEGAGNLVKREEIAELVKKFMDPVEIEGKEMRRRARQLQETCQKAIATGGSSDSNLDAFLRDILNSKGGNDYGK